MKNIYTLACLLFAQILSTQALASEVPDTALKQDKAFALAHVTPDLREQCVQDVKARNLRALPLKPAGKLSFNEPISRVVYRTLYWNNSDRGVAFTLPVTAKDPQLGEVTTQVACFYAVAENGLEFQLSQPLPWRVL